jgi:hypothetical protein
LEPSERSSKTSSPVSRKGNKSYITQIETFTKIATSSSEILSKQLQSHTLYNKTFYSWHSMKSICAFTREKFLSGVLYDGKQFPNHKTVGNRRKLLPSTLSSRILKKNKLKLLNWCQWIIGKLALLYIVWQVIFFVILSEEAYAYSNGCPVCWKVKSFHSVNQLCKSSEENWRQHFSKVLSKK